MPESHPLRLDRSKYHSSEHGDFANDIRFWQDGLPFDAHGQLCVAHCSPALLAQADKKGKRAKAARPAADGDDAGDAPVDPGDVNLELWAKGQARYVPAKVFAAIRERYNKSVSTYADAIEFLVNDAKLIPASQASQQLLSAGAPALVREEA